MAANLAYATSENAGSWSSLHGITNGYSAYGLQMAVYRGEAYGIMTQTVQYPAQLFASKYKIAGSQTGWKSFRSLPSLYRSQGRVAVAVLEDRFFVAYRGTDNHVYLIWTNDFDKWTSAGRVGSAYAFSYAAPAMAAHNGMLYITGVGEDQSMYYTICDSDGKKLTRWAKVEGAQTRSTVAMTVWDGSLYLFHTPTGNGSFGFQRYEGEKGFGQVNSVSAPSISSGVSVATWKYNGMVATYRGANKSVVYRVFNGQSWTPESSSSVIPGGVTMLSQTGLTVWGGRLMLSIPTTPGTALPSQRYTLTVPMSEKGGFVTEEEVNSEWECKWNQDGEEKKSMIRKFFCL